MRNKHIFSVGILFFCFCCILGCGYLDDVKREAKIKDYLHRKQFDKAMQEIDKFLVRNPNNQDYLHSKVIILIGTSQYKSAYELLNNILTIYPKDAEAWKLMGTLMEKTQDLNHMDLASKAYQKYLEFVDINDTKNVEEVKRKLKQLSIWRK